MPLPLYMNINRPEGLAQQIVTLIEFVDRYYPEYVEIIREIIREYVPVDVLTVAQSFVMTIPPMEQTLLARWYFTPELEYKEVI